MMIWTITYIIRKGIFKYVRLKFEHFFLYILLRSLPFNFTYDGLNHKISISKEKLQNMQGAWKFEYFSNILIQSLPFNFLYDDFNHNISIRKEKKIKKGAWKCEYFFLIFYTKLFVKGILIWTKNDHHHPAVL